MKSFGELHRQSVFNFLKRLNNSENVMIITLLKSDNYFVSKLVKVWNDALYIVYN